MCGAAGYGGEEKLGLRYDNVANHVTDILIT